MKILVAIPKPPDNQPSSVGRWDKAIQTCDIQAGQMGVSDTTKIGEGVWQLTEESQLPMLGLVLAAATNEKFPYRVEFDGKAAAWKHEP